MFTMQRDGRDDDHDAIVEGDRSLGKDSQHPIGTPLSPLEIWRANAEALQRAPETSTGASEARQHGRVEVEARRVSDEVTRQAQERKRVSASAHTPQGQSILQQGQGAYAAGDPSISPGTPDDGGKKDTAASPTALTRTLPPPVSFHTILAPLDGTSYAERALPYVTAIAHVAESSVTLVHVTAPVIPATVRVARHLVEQIVTGESESQAGDMSTYLEARRAQVASRVSMVRIVTIESSSVAVGLKQLAEREQSDLIVLATHARQGFERQVLGSTADELIERSHLPLLVIPPQALVPAGLPMFKHVLMPLDGSVVAEQALGLLLGLVQAATNSKAKRGEDSSWEVTLFTVVENDILITDAGAYLSEVETRLGACGLPQQGKITLTSLALVGSAPGAIVDIADHGPRAREAPGTPYDLVVMATHGHGGLGRLLFGSVAAYVLQHVTVPVLFVHPTDVVM